MPILAELQAELQEALSRIAMMEAALQRLGLDEEREDAWREDQFADAQGGDGAASSRFGTGSWAVTAADDQAAEITLNGGTITGWGAYAQIANGTVVGVGGTFGARQYVYVECTTPTLAGAQWHATSTPDYPVHETDLFKLVKWEVWIDASGKIKWEPHIPCDVRSWQGP